LLGPGQRQDGLQGPLPPAGDPAAAWLGAAGLAAPRQVVGTAVVAAAASRPPPNFTRASMRLLIGGWVANRPEKPASALFSRNMPRTSSGACSRGPPEILRRAEIIASGFLVSSTAPA